MPLGRGHKHPLSRAGVERQDLFAWRDGTKIGIVVMATAGEVFEQLAQRPMLQVQGRVAPQREAIGADFVRGTFGRAPAVPR